MELVEVLVEVTAAATAAVMAVDCQLLARQHIVWRRSE